MAPGRNDFLRPSFRQLGWISLLLKLLLSLSRVLWRGWEALSMIASSCNLSSTTSSSVGILRFVARIPGHHSEEDGPSNNRLVEHLEHPVADNKRPEPPQEVKPAQALLEDCLHVCRPLQFIVLHSTLVYVWFHNVNICPTSVDWRGRVLVPPEVHHHLLHLHHVQLQVVLPTSLNNIFDQVPVFSFPPSLYTPHNGCIIREFLQMIRLSAILKVRSVGGEKERRLKQFPDMQIR